MVIKITVEELATFQAVINSEKIKEYLTENVQMNLKTLNEKLEQSFYNKGVLV